MKRSPASRVSTLILAGSTCVVAQEAAPPLQPPRLPVSTPEPPESSRVIGIAPEPDAEIPAPLEPEIRRFTPRLPEPRPLSARSEIGEYSPLTIGRLGMRTDTSVPPLEPPRRFGNEPLGGSMFGNEDTSVPPLEAPDPIPLETVPDAALPSGRPSIEPLPKPEKKPKANRVETVPIEPRPRRRGFFGLFAPRPEPRPRPAKVSRGLDTSVDPAAEAALKSRIESQARQAGGRRLRSLEVRVRDGSITIRARADRFWNRRSLRRDLEDLPGLAGHDARVIVD